MEDGPTDELLVFVASKAFLSFFSSPFLVAQTLQSVQYKPSRAYLTTFGTLHSNYSENVVEPEEEDETSEIGGKDIEDPYVFLETQEARDENKPPFPATLSRDNSGYLVKSSYFEEDPTTPSFHLKLLPSSTLSTITIIFTNKYEGFRGLFKGNSLNLIHNTLHFLIQPIVEGKISDMFSISDDSIPLEHLDIDHMLPNLSISVASASFVGLLLNPLELARDRMIVQTSHPKHRRYNGIFSCLHEILQEDHSRLIFPTILYHTVTPLLNLSKTFFISRMFPYSLESPLSYSLLSLGYDIISLIITMPVTTIRRRLFIQPFDRIGGYRPFDTCISVSPLPYSGFWDCGSRIIAEEGEGGVKGLYRGFSIQVFGLVTSALLNTISLEVE